MAFLIQNTRTDDFIDNDGEWTVIRSFAKRFSTKQEAEQFIAKNQVKGDEPYMKVVKEMKGLKEFVKTKSLKEGNIKMHRDIDDVDVIIEPDGSYTFWKDGGKTKGAQNRSLRGQEGAVKELGALGYKFANKLNEATSNLREGFGELEVYTSFGPGFGVQIYPSRNGELTAHIGYVSNGSGNGSYKKELKTETELKTIDEIKIADLKGIERVLKKHLDALDSDLQKILKQYGYK